MKPGDWFTLRWSEGGVEILDQRLLPAEETYRTLQDLEAVAAAIEDLSVRGAPAIGCLAALGVALAARNLQADSPAALATALEPSFERLARTRPTAVNLFWALEKMRETLRRGAGKAGQSVAGLREILRSAAQELVDEDVVRCRSIGQSGLELVPPSARILTHCNAGALATAGYGTALGVVRAAAEAGRDVQVWADETRPFLQGARLTAWELARDGIPVTVVTDNMAGHLMQRGEVDLVLVGADRVAANGDVANKIGTYSLAVLAHAHGIPFYVAAPTSTIDLATPEGSGIPIEERSREEVAAIGAHQLVPDGVPVRHPAFDITPAERIAAIVTEGGIARPPYNLTLPRLVAAEG